MLSYILYHLELVWAFVRGDNEALYKIDATWRGVRLSFLAILIVEPVSFLYAALFGFLDRILLFRDGGLPYYLLQLILDWGMAPVIFFLFCHFFRFKDRLVPLIVSYNWLNVIVLAITLVPGAMMTSGLVGMEMALFLMLGIYGAVIWIAYRLYVFVLECPPSMALGLAILLLVLGAATAATMADISASLAAQSNGDIGTDIGTGVRTGA